MKSSRNFRKIKQPMDGNCFYHSVSTLIQYYNIGTFSHKELRKIVSDYYTKNRNVVRAANVLKLGEWADTEDVIATSNVLKVTIKVWETKNNMWVTFGNYKKKIYIFNQEMVHFDALIPVK